MISHILNVKFQDIYKQYPTQTPYIQFVYALHLSFEKYMVKEVKRTFCFYKYIINNFNYAIFFRLGECYYV